MAASTRRQNSEPSSSVVIETKEHAASLLEELNLMRTDRMLTDMVLVAGGKEVLCHRAVLAASSPYFRAMFHSSLRESREQRIKLDGVTALALNRLVDYIYTGRIEVTVDDAQDLLGAASLFQYAEVVDTCCLFLLSHLHPSNCLGIEAFGHHHVCSKLAADAHKFALENFEAVATESDEFVDLSVDRLESYVSNDEIEVRLEESVFEALLRWIGADVDRRRTAACSLMRHVRFASIASEYIQFTVLSNPIVSECTHCAGLTSSSSQIQCPRPSTIAKEVLVVIGGCDGPDTVLMSVEAYSPSKRCWKELPHVPEPMKWCSVTALDDDIFVSGGVVKGLTVSTVWRFVSTSQQWVSAPAMTQPRARHSSAAVARRLYVIGGTRDAAADAVVDSIECLDAGGDDALQRWRVVATVPCPRVDSHAAAYGGTSLVEVGGLQAGTGVVSTVELYQCRDGQLVHSGEQFVLPKPICRARVAAVDDVLYVVWTDLRELLSLNVERRIFRRLADLTWTHVDAGTTVLDGQVFITGGCASSDRAIAAVEVYDVKADRWLEVVPMTHARSGHGCVTIHMR